MVDIVVKYLQNEKKEQLWELYLPINITLSDNTNITIPEKFVTDFASVPKMFWSAIAPVGKYNLASVVHDYFYTNHGVTRAYADKEFLNLMNKYSPKTKLRNYTMYVMVRLFGYNRWKTFGN